DPAVVLAHGWTDGASDLVARDVPEERRRDERQAAEEQPQQVGPAAEVELVGGQEDADRHHERVTGQEREEQPALDEDDDQADQDELGPEMVQQPLGLHPGDAEEEWLEYAGHTIEPIRRICP